MIEMSVPFLKQVQSLSTGEKAVMRRSVGTLLRDAEGSALATFYRCLPHGTPWHQEDRWYAVACLQCLYREKVVVENTEPLEQIIARLVSEEVLSNSTLHRIEDILDTPWDSEGHLLTKLTRLIRLIRQKSGNAVIDFNSLLEDLIYWNTQDQAIQKKWARTIFAKTK